MFNFKKYQVQVINYNIIVKKNYYNFINLYKIIITSFNKYIISIYNMLFLLLSIKLIYNVKSYILKNKKLNLYTGLQKNDNLGVKIDLTLKNKNFFLSKLLFSYSSIIDLTRKYYITKNHNVFSFTINNINKIDSILIKEYKLLPKIDFRISLITHLKYKKKKDTLKIYLLLTHLGFLFNYYEK